MNARGSGCDCRRSFLVMLGRIGVATLFAVLMLASRGSGQEGYPPDLIAARRGQRAAVIRVSAAEAVSCVDMELGEWYGLQRLTAEVLDVVSPSASPVVKGATVTFQRLDERWTATLRDDSPAFGRMVFVGETLLVFYAPGPSTTASQSAVPISVAHDDLLRVHDGAVRFNGVRYAVPSLWEHVGRPVALADIRDPLVRLQCCINGVLNGDRAISKIVNGLLAGLRETRLAPRATFEERTIDILELRDLCIEWLIEESGIEQAKARQTVIAGLAALVADAEVPMESRECAANALGRLGDRRVLALSNKKLREAGRIGFAGRTSKGAAKKPSTAATKAPDTPGAKTSDDKARPAQSTDLEKRDATIAADLDSPDAEIRRKACAAAGLLSLFPLYPKVLHLALDGPPQSRLTALTALCLYDRALPDETLQRLFTRKADIKERLVVLELATHDERPIYAEQALALARDIAAEARAEGETVICSLPISSRFEQRLVAVLPRLLQGGPPPAWLAGLSDGDPRVRRMYAEAAAIAVDPALEKAMQARGDDPDRRVRSLAGAYETRLRNTRD